MLIDTHIHTNRYSGCSILDPISLVYQASKLGISGIVIVEHYNVWSQEEIEELKREIRSDLLILRGQEVSCSIGHLLVFGYYEKLQEGLSVEEIVDKVHNKGGIVIMAHPFRDGNNVGEELAKLGKKFACVDGIEVFSGNHSEEENKYAERVWNALKIVSLGGSDAHSIGMVGKYLTWFQNVIKDEGDYIAEIKAGRCKPIRYENNSIVAGGFS